MLAVSEKGLARQDIRIPQGDLAGGQRFLDKFLPDVIFQDQVGQKLVLRETDS